MPKEQKFNFKKPWGALTNTEKAIFTIKVKQIEIDSFLRLAIEYDLDFDVVYQNVQPRDPQAEWESTEPEKGLPCEITWIEFEIQFMRDELVEKEGI